MTIIAMTREIGSHGSEVAAGVAAALGLEIINSGVLGSREIPDRPQRHIFGWTRRRKSLAFSWCKPTIPTANLTAISRMRSCRHWWSRSRGRRTYGYGSKRAALLRLSTIRTRRCHTEKLHVIER
jgi:hypothetical protein